MSPPKEQPQAHPRTAAVGQSQLAHQAQQGHGGEDEIAQGTGREAQGPTATIGGGEGKALGFPEEHLHSW
ncbi:MAG: hypothetical protein ACKOOC_01815 [Cyanobium sp.]